MSAIGTKIFNAVKKEGGSASWEQALSSLTDGEKRRGMQEIRALEAEGVLRRIVAHNPKGKPTFVVQLADYQAPSA